MAGDHKRAWYICSPYTHEEPCERNWRARIAARLAAKLMGADVLAFSPVPGGHLVEEEANDHSLRIRHSLWMRQAILLLPAFDGLIKLELPGHTVSSGMNQELKAWGKDKPVVRLILADVEQLSGTELATEIERQARAWAGERAA